MVRHAYRPRSIGRFDRRLVAGVDAKNAHAARDRIAPAQARTVPRPPGADVERHGWEDVVYPAFVPLDTRVLDVMSARICTRT